MIQSNLVLHRGARQVSLEELDAVLCPEGSASWYPVAHSTVLGKVSECLTSAGFSIDRMELALSPDDARFFGTLTLKDRVTNEAALAVGVRNSLDKSFALGFVAGARVFCCDNLAFTSSEVLVSRKHTRWGETRYAEAISLATTKLGAFQAQEARRINCLQQWELSPQEADSLILQAYEKDIIGARLLPLAIKAWRNPPMEDFRPRTGWSLLNAFTEVLKERQKSSPQEAALQTIQLQRLLNPPPDVIDVDSTPVIAG